MPAISSLRNIFDRTAGHCYFCGDKVSFKKRGWKSGSMRGYWETDHVIQRSKGGRKSSDNCLPACTRCNRLRWHRKGDQLRELILYGIITRNLILTRSPIGKAILKLKRERLVANKKRRKQ